MILRAAMNVDFVRRYLCIATLYIITHYWVKPCGPTLRPKRTCSAIHKNTNGTICNLVTLSYDAVRHMIVYAIASPGRGLKALQAGDSKRLSRLIALKGFGIGRKLPNGNRSLLPHGGSPHRLLLRLLLLLPLLPLQIAARVQSDVQFQRQQSQAHHHWRHKRNRRRSTYHRHHMPSQANRKTFAIQNFDPPTKSHLKARRRKI
mmetsp:Transcript_26635/g.63494  ORF Transcript_26635/g.63494 Transcript_26635/m.63494 type:complete len:204 (+) Transcript_26635:335-946(+)